VADKILPKLQPFILPEVYEAHKFVKDMVDKITLMNGLERIPWEIHIVNAPGECAGTLSNGGCADELR
jgi:hypothetical protein